MRQLILGEQERMGEQGRMTLIASIAQQIQDQPIYLHHRVTWTNRLVSRHRDLTTHQIRRVCWLGGGVIPRKLYRRHLRCLLGVRTRDRYRVCPTPAEVLWDLFKQAQQQAPTYVEAVLICQLASKMLDIDIEGVPAQAWEDAASQLYQTLSHQHQAVVVAA